MLNPLFKVCNKNDLLPRAKERMPSASEFKSELTKRGPDFLQKMQALARQRGISERDIEQGMKMINTL